MNCQEFRQHYLSEPRSHDSAYLEHLQTCHACTEFAAQETAFEQALAGALAVPVPENLSARVILNQAIQQPRWPYGLSAAAAVLLILIPVTLLLLRPWSTSLEQDVLTHITDEREHLAARDRVPESKVLAVLETIGVAGNPFLSNVHYAGVCPIRHHLGGHLIVAGTQGPVTILFMPREAIGQQQRIDADGFHGIIVPHGAGSVAIVGQSGEALDDFKRQLLITPEVS